MTFLQPFWLRPVGMSPAVSCLVSAFCGKGLLVNKCMFSGRLVSDPEMKTTRGGKTVARFTLVVNNKKKVGEEWQDDPSFLDFDIWDTGAERFCERAKKGTFVIIDDSTIRTDRWETPDGQKRQKHVWRCNHFEFPPAPKGQSQAQAQPEREPEPAGVAGDSDIPF